MTYKVSAKVVYNDGEGVKVDALDIVNSALLTDDKQAEKWGKIIFAGLKKYYTKKDYEISVRVVKQAAEETVFEDHFDYDTDY